MTSVQDTIKKIQYKYANPNNYDNTRSLQTIFEIKTRKQCKEFMYKTIDYHQCIHFNGVYTLKALSKSIACNILTFVSGVETRIPKFRKYKDIQWYLNIDDSQSTILYDDFKYIVDPMKTKIIKWMTNFGLKTQDITRVINSGKNIQLIYKELKQMRDNVPMSSNNNRDNHVNYFAKDIVSVLKPIVSKPMNKLKILDIGSGTGDLADSLISLTHADLHCIDIRDSNQGSCVFQVYDGHTIPFNSEFDIAIMSMVLHHIDPDNRHELYTEIARILNNGLFVIREHNAVDSNTIHYLNIQHSFYALTGTPVESPDFLSIPMFFQSKKQWIQEIISSGFKIVTSKNIGMNFIAVFKPVS